MFWTIFFAVLCALSAFELLKDANPLLLLHIIIKEDERGDFRLRTGTKVIGLLALCSVIVVLSLIRQ